MATTKRQASAASAKAKEAARVHAIFAAFRASCPHPRGELNYTNPFTLLVAVVLSAQATDASVNKATALFFPLADSPRKLVALGEARLRDFIKSIGLYRTKARNVLALSRTLISRHAGLVPAEREQLEELPGVGRKTANVVLNIAFGRPTIAVDTHVFRVSNRLALAVGNTPLQVELGLEKAVADEFKLHAHHWLILHGRYICKARKPLCERCGIFEFCGSPDKLALPRMGQ